VGRGRMGKARGSGKKAKKGFKKGKRSLSENSISEGKHFLGYQGRRDDPRKGETS